ncbi:MAG: preprotein translocase subunit SecE [Bryobacteraceae bacterium]|jgi:preprotein translocase subunit SecE
MADEKKNWIESAKDYVNDLRLEMRRVSWPNRKQVESTTGVVIFSVFAFAAYFFVVDSLVGKIVKGILAYFSK